MRADGNTRSTSLADRLRALDACSVSDALDGLGLVGVVAGPKPVWGCAPIAGRAVTVRLELVDPDAAPPPVHLGVRAIEQAEPGDVIVVDNADRRDVSGWGGLLSKAARMRAVAGVIVFGACRDVQDAEALGLPLYATATTPRTARRRVVEAAVGEPLELGGVEIRPGDYVLADRNGVVVVGKERASDVVEKAEEVARREARLAERLDGGEPVADVLGASYETIVRPATTADSREAR